MPESEPNDPLAALAARIDQAKGTPSDDSASNSVSGNQLSMAWRISIELVAGVVVGGIIGYFADKYSGLSPLFIMLGIMLGAIAGFRNMARSIKNAS